MTEPTSAVAKPRCAMVLAAGLGTRMHPLTERMPKPLVAVGGKPLLDHVLDRLADAGVERAVVNVHHMADQIVEHVRGRRRPEIVISDERAALLGTGGGVVKALPALGDGPFFHLNADTIWIEGPRPNLARLAGAFDPLRMDVLLLLAPRTTSIGYDGRGDFSIGSDGVLVRRGARESAPFVYAGVAVLSRDLFVDAPAGAFGLTQLFDRAEAQRRLRGLPLEGTWMHVGTPGAIGQAEAAILESAA
jgi:N-acetyl-alpha-D-muramate 1-phosphate uridylyltransferase